VVVRSRMRLGILLVTVDKYQKSFFILKPFGTTSPGRIPAFEMAKSNSLLGVQPRWIASNTAGRNLGRSNARVSHLSSRLRCV